MQGGFDFGVIAHWLPLLARGMVLSIELTVLAILGGIGIGTVLAAMRLSKNPLLSLPAGFYVNFFRSIPLVLVIFWFYFTVPIIAGHPINAFYSALIAFTFFEAAYFCEIVRAGIMSVSRGQTFAGQAIGLTPLQTMVYIILPQAIRNMLPILVTRSIILFQDTSLVYVIGLHDFLTSADLVATRENRLVELYVFAAVVYLAICMSGSVAARALARRTAR